MLPFSLSLLHLASQSDELQREEMGIQTHKCCFKFKPPAFSHSRVDVAPPEDVRDPFSYYAGGQGRRVMGEEDLRRYLKVSQGTAGHDDDDVVDRLLEQIRPTQDPGSRRRRFTLRDFHHFLYSHDLNPPIPHQHVHHDMTLPLSQYFIYTAHNNPDPTRPNQQWWRGRSGGGDPIIRALKMGVRAIEVSMWPNSKQDDIQVLLHGRARNDAPVLLIECLKSIKGNAFVASPYPVILTLEDNLPTANLQKKAAEVVLHELGDILYWPDTDRIDISHYHIDAGRVVVLGSTDHLKDFPSPQELKGRVLLSTKTPNLTKKKKPAVPPEVGSKVGGTMQKGDIDDDATLGPEIADFQNEIQSAKKYYDDSSDDNEEQEKIQAHEYPYQDLVTIEPGKQIGSMQSAAKMLLLHGASVPMFLRGARPGPMISYRNADDTLQSDPDKVRCLTLSKEEIIERAAHSGTDDIVRFTTRNILWIYPGGTHLTSSNYNPFLGWVYGAQMVALNMQEYGRALWLIHGFYKANGGCGYVRKPDILMPTETKVFDPRNCQQPVMKTLKVKVYMGDGWRMDFKHAHTFIPDLWTSVGIAGVPADTTVMQDTKATEGNWYPVWGDEFSFPLTVPEIALLRVEVHRFDKFEKDVFGGQTVLPVSELRPGIRAVALFDRQGNRFDNVRLLMRFEFV